MSAGKPYPFITPAGELYLWETMKLLVHQKGADDVEAAAAAAVKMAREDARRSLPPNVILFPGRD